MKGVKRHFALFLAFTFTLSCLLPVRVALALKDCGPHEIVSCESHDDEHYVARHVSDGVEIAKGSEAGRFASVASTASVLQPLRE